MSRMSLCKCPAIGKIAPQAVALPCIGLSSHQYVQDVTGGSFGTRYVM